MKTWSVQSLALLLAAAAMMSDGISEAAQASSASRIISNEEGSGSEMVAIWREFREKRRRQAVREARKVQSQYEFWEKKQQQQQQQQQHEAHGRILEDAVPIIETTTEIDEFDPSVGPVLTTTSLPAITTTSIDTPPVPVFPGVFVQPPWWAAYRAIYRRRYLKKCRFLETPKGIQMPVTGGTCPQKEIHPHHIPYTCLFGEQFCDAPSLGSVHPVYGCNCTESLTWTCYEWDPCPRLNTCPDEPPVGSDAKCALPLTCTYDEGTCCGEPYKKYSCRCDTDGKFTCQLSDPCPTECPGTPQPPSEVVTGQPTDAPTDVPIGLPPPFECPPLSPGCVGTPEEYTCGTTCCCDPCKGESCEEQCGPDIDADGNTFATGCTCLPGGLGCVLDNCPVFAGPCPPPPGCPETPPVVGASCDGFPDEGCSYGDECCCGPQCFPGDPPCTCPGGESFSEKGTYECVNGLISSSAVGCPVFTCPPPEPMPGDRCPGEVQPEPETCLGSSYMCKYGEMCCCNNCEDPSECDCPNGESTVEWTCTCDFGSLECTAMSCTIFECPTCPEAMPSDGDACDASVVGICNYGEEEKCCCPTCGETTCDECPSGETTGKSCFCVNGTFTCFDIGCPEDDCSTPVDDGCTDGLPNGLDCVDSFFECVYPKCCCDECNSDVPCPCPGGISNDGANCTCDTLTASCVADQCPTQDCSAVPTDGICLGDTPPDPNSCLGTFYTCNYGTSCCCDNCSGECDCPGGSSTFEFECFCEFGSVNCSPIGSCPVVTCPNITDTCPDAKPSGGDSCDPSSAAICNYGEPSCPDGSTESCFCSPSGEFLCFTVGCPDQESPDVCPDTLPTAGDCVDSTFSCEYPSCCCDPCSDEPCDCPGGVSVDGFTCSCDNSVATCDVAPCPASTCVEIPEDGTCPNGEPLVSENCRQSTISCTVGEECCCNNCLDTCDCPGGVESLQTTYTCQNGVVTRTTQQCPMFSVCPMCPAELPNDGDECDAHTSAVCTYGEPCCCSDCDDEPCNCPEGGVTTKTCVCLNGAFSCLDTGCPIDDCETTADDECPEIPTGPFGCQGIESLTCEYERCCCDPCSADPCECPGGISNDNVFAVCTNNQASYQFERCPTNPDDCPTETEIMCPSAMPNGGESCEVGQLCTYGENNCPESQGQFACFCGADGTFLCLPVFCPTDEACPENLLRASQCPTTSDSCVYGDCSCPGADSSAITCRCVGDNAVGCEARFCPNC